MQWRLLVPPGARIRPEIAFVHSSDAPESCRQPTPTGLLPRPGSHVSKRIINRTDGKIHYTLFWSNPMQKEVRCQTINNRNQGGVTIVGTHVVRRWSRENGGSGLTSIPCLKEKLNTRQVPGIFESESWPRVHRDTRYKASRLFKLIILSGTDIRN